MTEVLAGLRVTETVAAALSLAATRRSGGRSLDTQTLLWALAATDTVGDWHRLLLTDQPASDPASTSVHTWAAVPLTGTCAEALARARTIAETYDLLPMPPGVLAVALVWDPASGAARACLGMQHHELLRAMQDDVLGTDLEGLENLLADRGSSHKQPTPASEIAPPRDPGAGREITKSDVDLTFAKITTRAPVWLLRLLLLAAVGGAVAGLLTSPVWSVTVPDDLAPPLRAQPVSSAMPDDTAMSRLVGVEFVRTQNGLPLGTKLFDSNLALWHDTRNEAVHSAWETRWDSTDGRTQATVQVIQLKTKSPLTSATHGCNPATTAQPSPGPPVLQAGYVAHDKNSGLYCMTGFDKQALIFIALRSLDGSVVARMPDSTAATWRTIQQKLPSPAFPVKDGISTPISTALLNRGPFLAVLGLIFLWMLPTLLFDRATWQRLWSFVNHRRYRSRSLPGLDIDAAVRAQLSSAMALSATQLCAAIWMLRLTFKQGMLITSVSTLGIVFIIGAIPRILHLRRVGSQRGFQVRRSVVWLTGILLGVTAVGFSVVLILLANTLSTTGAGYDVPDYQQLRFNTILEVMAIPTAIVAIAPTMLARRIAMRTLRKRRGEDPRPPILLLRSFADDGRRLRSRSSHRRALPDRLSLRRWERFEEVIAASLGAHGPVYAVGQVGERLPPPLGAVRRQFTNDEWQNRIQGLMAEASIICVTLGRSTALDWEIRRIAELGFLPKAVFVLPPTSRREHIKRLAVLAAALKLAWADLDIRPTGGWALAIRVPAVGSQPQVIRARAQEDMGYDIALDLTRLAADGVDLLNLPSLAADDRSGAPTAEVYPPGKTPIFKSLFRRKGTRLLLLLNGSAIVTLLFAFLTGEVKDTSAVITLAESSAWTAVAADPDTAHLYGIADATRLATLDFDDGKASLVCEIEAAGNLTAGGGWLFASNSFTGTLQAIDPADKRVAWTRRDLPGVRGVVATDAAVYLLLPAAREVRELDRRTGDPIASRKLDGIPWAAARSDDGVLVSILDSSSIVRVDRTLTKVTQTGSRIDATQIVSVRGTAWAYSRDRHAVFAVGGSAQVIYTRSQSPHIASNGSVLAIEGIEQTSTFWPDGTVVRNRLSTRHADSLAVTSTGDVLAMADNEVLLIRASKR
ncbi:hypothetical protein [Amycolatopsis rifamycinica]|nr:hypothetical protein [Amycolatopsis rifamycinica]